MAEQTPILEMKNIVKHFPGVLANDHIDFSVNEGEVHALLGENGAGKSTLMNILSGLYQPEEGDIWIHRERVQFNSPRDAIEDGIGMIHQHFMLVPSHTVSENIILGMSEPRFSISPQKVEKEVTELSERYNIQVDPRARIWQLSVGEQQRVEVLKMLYRGTTILIMDEPTAVLTPQEVDQLFTTLREMTASGHTIIFISHKLDEVLEIADRITVLRRGKVEASALDASSVTKDELARVMVGREVLFRIDKDYVDVGEVVLEVDQLEALDDRGLPALRQILFEIRAGEILGIAGVAGNGQRELAETICGLRHATSGTVRLSSQEITNKSPRSILVEGVSYIPEDRVGVGSVPNMSVAENLALRSYRDEPIGRGFSIDLITMEMQAKELVDEYDIKTPSVDTPSCLLSGGNLQKLILARELSAEPGVLIAVHPTRGLDVGATEAVQQILLEERKRGVGVLMISEDLDELLTVSDRIAVIYEGQIIGTVDAEDAKVEEIGLMMAGSQIDEST